MCTAPKFYFLKPCLKCYWYTTHNSEKFLHTLPDRFRGSWTRGAQQVLFSLYILNEFSFQLQIGPWKLTQNIIQQQGVLGLFRGLGSTIAREMPGYFFFFGGYEATRGLLTPAGKAKDEIGIELCTVVPLNPRFNAAWKRKWKTKEINSS